jgi:hypothetical protein
MFYVVYESESLFRPTNYKNVAGFESEEEAVAFAKEKLEEGYPKVVVAKSVAVYHNKAEKE